MVSNESVACKPYEEGGLKMFDVSSFLAAVRVSSLGRINCAGSSLSNFVTYLYPEFVNLGNCGGELQIF